MVAERIVLLDYQTHSGLYSGQMFKLGGQSTAPPALDVRQPYSLKRKSCSSGEPGFLVGIKSSRRLNNVSLVCESADFVLKPVTMLVASASLTPSSIKTHASNLATYASVKCVLA